MKENQSSLVVICVLLLFGFGAANAADKTTRVPVLEAFNKGDVELVFDATMVNASGKLTLSVKNLTTSPLSLTLPKGPTVFDVGGPLGTLTIESDRIQNLEISAGNVQSLSVSQSGQDQLTGGKLTIKMTPNGTSANAEKVSIGSPAPTASTSSQKPAASPPAAAASASAAPSTPASPSVSPAPSAEADPAPANVAAKKLVLHAKLVRRGRGAVSKANVWILKGAHGGWIFGKDGEVLNPFAKTDEAGEFTVNIPRAFLGREQAFMINAAIPPMMEGALLKDASGIPIVLKPDSATDKIDLGEITVR